MIRTNTFGCEAGGSSRYMGAPWWRRKMGRACTMNMIQRLGSVLAFLVYFNSVQWQAAAETLQRDVQALNALYSVWNVPGSGIPEWSGTDPCGDNWQGVSCTRNEVTKLTLPNFNLSGGIPPAIGQLASLTNLDLSFNQGLGGSIPKELQLLTSLSSLSIRKSGLTGSIPKELGNCQSLTFLALDQNSLSGPIPDQIGNLNKLDWFDISENLIEGPLPVSARSTDNIGLDNLTSVEHFHFNNNSITGDIPDEIFNLTNLVHLLLDGNKLQGSVSPAVSNAKSLKILRLGSNGLGRALPDEIGNLTHLLELNLNGNSFTGTLPDLTGLTNLLLLDVSNNNFARQEIPTWMYEMNSLSTLLADSAELVGNVNPSLFALPSLSTLSLKGNALNGTLTFPSNSPSSLVLIDLQNNNFDGVSGQPRVGGVNSQSITVRLAGNPFCSGIGTGGSAYCTAAVDTPPSWVAPSNNCHQTCSDNKSLNPDLCLCAFPLICSMQLTSPSFLSVNDTFMADFRDEWAEGFSLTPNQVFIPSANFSNNGRLVFDLQFFPTSGDSLPSSVVQNITSSLSGNSFSLKEAPYLLRNYTLPLATHSSKSKNTALVIGIVVAAILVACIILLIVVYAIRQKRRADRAEVSRPFASWGTTKGEGGEAPQLKGARWFSLAELKKATNNFSESNEIGSGGYGKVYKAVLPSGEVVAVKRAEDGSMQGATEFKNEIETLSRLHHRNLVGLVGFCYEQNEEMLVYEYMSRGTLRDHLLGLTDYPLSWESRVSIALGSARGLAYLHDLANPPLIHRDVKSSNILLDEKMVAKVADFGLSKLAPDEGGKNHVSTQVKGTLGYLDPEYYMTNQLSEKSDVYSFGVVLLETLSARPPIERGRYIVREVRTALDKGGFTAFKPLLDPFIGDYPVKQLEAMLNLALRCVEEAAADRPTMNEVVKELEVIAGNSGSGVHITIEPQRSEDLYSGKNLTKKDSADPSFEYSGYAIAPPTVEPK